MGRPQEFDREQVLHQAMAVFHRQGYSATSVPDLVKATKLQPGSLYAAFKSKKGILLEVLRTYADNFARDMKQLFASHEKPLDGIRAMLVRITDDCGTDKGKQGCLMVNMLLEMSSQDDEIAALLESLFARSQKLIAEQLQRAIDAGDLDPKRDPQVMAKFILTNLWGLRVLGKTQPEPEEMRSVIDLILISLNSCAKASRQH